MGSIHKEARILLLCFIIVKGKESSRKMKTGEVMGVGIGDGSFNAESVEWWCSMWGIKVEIVEYCDKSITPCEMVVQGGNLSLKYIWGN